MRPLLRLSGRPVVVTGAGRGLGREIALTLARKRAIVFGTACSSREAEELRSASSGRVSLIVCDTENVSAVNAWAAGVLDAIGDTGLDLLINTGEQLAKGPLELVPLEDVRRGFVASVFGGIAVINAFLPALRKAQGRIVQVTPCASDAPSLFDGPSSAVRAAAEAFSVAYRAELKPFGIEVLITSTCGFDAETAGAAEGLARIDSRMTAVQRKLYGRLLRVCMARLAAANTADAHLSSAERVVDLAVQGAVTEASA
jgi:NAD(P)-dependent dehydrogenase (short-subunit alcohol dehydrogenase family)